MNLQEAALLPLTQAADADRMFAALQALALQHGVALRAPPPHPSSCCGRGCNGCVWEGFMDAALFWREDAMAALQGDACTPKPPR
jgi:hypothetical protein